MSISSTQSRTIAHAGYAAYLIGVPNENNPYKGPDAAHWAKGWRFSKENHSYGYNAEVKLALLLGLPTPKREVKPRTQVKSVQKPVSPVQKKFIKTTKPKSERYVQRVGRSTRQGVEFPPPDPQFGIPSRFKVQRAS